MFLMNTKTGFKLIYEAEQNRENYSKRSFS